MLVKEASGDTYVHEVIESSLVWVLAFHLFETKSSPESMLIVYLSSSHWVTGIILCKGPADERQRYSLIG